MGRKNTARATPIADKNVYKFVIGIKGLHGISEVNINATSIHVLGDCITVYMNEEVIGEFCDWCYWNRVNTPSATEKASPD